MPLYRLTPNDETGLDPAWERTGYWGAAFIQASAEVEARQVADRAFARQPSDDQPGPWCEPRLVAAREDTWHGERAGLVYVPWHESDPDGLRVRLGSMT